MKWFILKPVFLLMGLSRMFLRSCFCYNVKWRAKYKDIYVVCVSMCIDTHVCMHACMCAQLHKKNLNHSKNRLDENQPKILIASVCMKLCFIVFSIFTFSGIFKTFSYAQ